MAHALTQILVKSPKIDDTLVLESILATPLIALRKRGYNVDRILNQQREERLRFQAEEENNRRTAAAAKAREAALSSPTSAAIGGGAGEIDPPPYSGQKGQVGQLIACD